MSVFSHSCLKHTRILTQEWRFQFWDFMFTFVYGIVIHPKSFPPSPITAFRGLAQFAGYYGALLSVNSYARLKPNQTEFLVCADHVFRC